MMIILSNMYKLPNKQQNLQNVNKKIVSKDAVTCDSLTTKLIIIRTFVLIIFMITSCSYEMESIVHDRNEVNLIVIAGCN